MPFTVQRWVHKYCRFNAGGSLRRFPQTFIKFHDKAQEKLSGICQIVGWRFQDLHKYGSWQVELNQIGKDFCYEIAQFPNTVGAIDGKYMRIKSPSDEHIVNLKNYNYFIHIQFSSYVSLYIVRDGNCTVWCIKPSKTCVCKLFSKRYGIKKN